MFKNVPDQGVLDPVGCVSLNVAAAPRVSEPESASGRVKIQYAGIVPGSPVHLDHIAFVKPLPVHVLDPDRVDQARILQQESGSGG